MRDVGVELGAADDERRLDDRRKCRARRVEMRAGPRVVEAIKRRPSIPRCGSCVIHRAFVGEHRVVHEHGILFRLGYRVEVRAELGVEEAVNWRRVRL